MDNKERLTILQLKLREIGVLDIKITWNPDATFLSWDEKASALADSLESYFEDNFEEIDISNIDKE